MATKIEKLINMDYNAIVNLSKTENVENLKSVVSSLARSANIRITKLTKDEVGKYSPAYKSLVDSGIKRFNEKQIKDMTSTQLVEQYNTLKRFLKAKTSTLKGWKEVRKAIGERTGAKKLFATERKSARSAKLWQNREKRFWDLYNKLVNNYGAIISQLDSNRIQEMLSKVQLSRNQAKTDDDISEAMIVYIDNLYKDRSFSDQAFIDALKTEEYMEEVRIAYDEIAGN